MKYSKKVQDGLYEALKNLLDIMGNPMEIPPFELVLQASEALAKAEED